MTLVATALGAMQQGCRTSQSFIRLAAAVLQPPAFLQEFRPRAFAHSSELGVDV